MTDIIPSKTATGKAEAFDAGRDEAIEIGQWYWVKPQKDGGRWLGCVMTIGSNYVELLSPKRAEYFKWAPLLLAAEDYHAGKIKLNQPDKVINDYGPY